LSTVKVLLIIRWLTNDDSSPTFGVDAFNLSENVSRGRGHFNILETELLRPLATNDNLLRFVGKFVVQVFQRYRDE
jgi:hypothetical protein